MKKINYSKAILVIEGMTLMAAHDIDSDKARNHDNIYTFCHRLIGHCETCREKNPNKLIDAEYKKLVKMNCFDKDTDKTIRQEAR